ncbi:hypothetical protein [Tepidimonas charontis]|uniref:YGGT family protein n=1 Tax=Tepidimonas charontis TaxID=2267262 RepID=A0A554XEK2_9BURK|nr:hypothetical protein [Tepidimonas charontis]TSE34271.1 hypothetical protein Tchar_01479 [Tepidimonas charontis]
MLFWLNAAQLVLYIGLLALLGQGVLYIIAGQRRADNLFYQLFQVLNRPWVALARWITPRQLAPQHLPVVAFCAMAALYLAVTLAKIEHCIAVGMEGCR